MLIVGHDRFLTYYGSEFTAQVVRDWLKHLQVKTLYIEPEARFERVGEVAKKLYIRGIAGKTVLHLSPMQPGPW